MKGQHEAYVLEPNQHFCNVHDERVLAIISLPGILLSGTGVRCQPYLQRSNFTAKKEQFSEHKRTSSTCQSLSSEPGKTHQPRSDSPQLGERGESVN